MTHFLSKLCTILVTFVALTTSVNAVSLATHESANQAKKTIKVGIYAPFSSDTAYIGRNMLGAMEIARDQLKSSEINYEFFPLDKLPDNSKAAGTLQKFIDVHHINVLVTEGSESGAIVAPLAKKNDLIHFCLTSDDVVADGKNTFLTQSPNHKSGAILAAAKKPEFVAQFKQEYFSHPVTEAGYAYDIFHLLNNSAVIAMKTTSNFSSQEIATNLLALQSGTGLVGVFNLDKEGVSYKKGTLTA